MNRFLTISQHIKQLKHGRQVLPFHSSNAIIITRQKSTKLNQNPNKNSHHDGEPLVISGISGRFPRSHNFEEFKTNLYSGVDMVQEQERFVSERLPRRVGCMYDLDKFDAGFFGIVPKLADNMDPEQRMLMEATFEAILDSGTNPEKLKGSKVGVFVGSAGGESSIHALLYGSESNADGYIVIGQSNFMLPNRLSFAFDFKGPSLHISTGCSASLIALETAAAAIRGGSCDAAIVAGSSCYLNGKFTHEMMAIGALAMDGKCKSFDSRADGFTRAEAIVAILLQKEKDAKRSYARVRKVQSNADGYKPEGVAYPSGKAQAALLSEVYENIDPSMVSFIEAHGTGTPIGDPQELGAISDVFCKSIPRENPLLVGSVKSNMGHGESAAGLCGLAKVLAVFQTGFIPPNLHFKEPNPDCTPLLDGTIKVVNEVTPFPGGLAGLNSFGLGGTNVHAVMEPYQSSRSSTENTTEIPILLPLSGRTKEGLEYSIQKSFESSTNPEFRALVHEAFRNVIPGHSYRGYGIISPGDKEGLVSVESFDGLRSRPVWYVFPGMGCQWNEMHIDMMKVDVFAESFNKSKATLKNIGIDLDQVLKADNPSIFNNIRLAFVSIAAVQIALLECLSSLGVKPDGFFGHSVGEMLCAYADGCLTAEETLLMSDARGRAFLEGQPMPGGMASVGLSWAEMEARCPPGIYTACNNGPSNVSISGPIEDIKSLVSSLQKDGIFAREVNTCGTSPHCVYVDSVRALMDKYFGEILGASEKSRSRKWISTSVPKDKVETEALYSSAQYHARNARNPVLFYEATKQIPKNALVLEVGPRGLFQAILKETIPAESYYVKFMDPKASCGAIHFLDAVGKIYTKGVEVNVANLYPPVSFPVPSNTPSVAHLASWDHGASWKVPFIKYPRKSGHITRIDLQDPKFSYLRGHSVGNRIIYPTTGYLWLAWRTYADAWGCNLENFPVRFEDIHLERATFLSEKRPTEFMFSMLDGRGNFEIRENDEVVVRAKMTRLDNSSSNMASKLPPFYEGTRYLNLNTQDAYKELGLRGYRYNGEFRGIKFVDNGGKWAKVLWKGNWVTFLDTVMQTMLFSALTRSTLVPVRFREVTINPAELVAYVESVRLAEEKAELNNAEEVEKVEVEESGQEKKVEKDVEDDGSVAIPVSIQSHLSTIRCPGVEVREIIPTIVQMKTQAEKLAFQKHEFSPFMEPGSVKTFQDGVWEAIDLVLENSPALHFEAIDIFLNKDNSLASIVNEVFKYTPKVKTIFKSMTTTSEAEKFTEEEANAVSLVPKDQVTDLIPFAQCELVFLDDSSLLEQVCSNLSRGFVALHGQQHIESVPEGTVLVSNKSFREGSSLILLRKKPALPCSRAVHQLSITPNLEWLPRLQELISEYQDLENARIYLTSEGEPTSGILGLVKCLRLESGGDKIRCIFNFDHNPKMASKTESSDDGPSNALEIIPPNVIETDLAFNVYKNDVWGSYRHLPIQEVQTLKPVEHAQLAQLVPGDLTSFRWIESPLKYYKPSKDSYIKRYNVAYAAFNFRDVMIAAGKLPLDPYTAASGRIFGWEFSGFDEEGNRVTGIPLTSSFATTVLADSRCVTSVPENWTLEEAATIPMAYQAALNMVHRGRLQRGQSVLIHSGAGGVGQAAINIALAHDCEIFTTVGTDEKRRRLKELFPQLKEENIGNSRDCSFESLIMERTNGRGVDMVLNSLAGDKLQASVRCLARSGKFLEIGAFDAFQNEPLGMSAFLKNTEFHGIFQAWDFKADANMDFMLVPRQELSEGWISPLASTVFKINEIESAFRYFASGKSIGKILIQMQAAEENAAAHVSQPTIMQAYAKTYFHPEKVYLIVGGLGGLGLEMANWLVERGARHIILTSRSGVTSGYQSLCIRKWEEKGVTAETPKIDFSDLNVAEKFIAQPGLAERIGGIFNSGLVLKDTLIERMTKEEFEEVFPPKIMTTRNLDILTRKLCKNLDYFVVCSSGACSRGNPGQSNYAYANSVMERICEERVKDGLHGLAVQWGIIGEVGFVAEKLFKGKDLALHEELAEAAEGVKPQSIASCLNILDQAMQLPHPVCSSMIIADRDTENMTNLSLAERIKTIFGIDLEKINPSIKLTDLGMDSMILFELKQTLERDYDLPMTSNQLRHLTLGDIKAIDAGTFAAANLGVKSQNVSPSDIADIVLYEECLVQLKEIPEEEKADHNGNNAPLFVIHGIPGSAAVFKHLAENLNLETYGLQFGPHSKPESVAHTAAVYLEQLRRVQPHGPYNIAAYSSGGPVAYEMTVQLETIYGEKVENLIFLDGTCCWETYNINPRQFFVHLAHMFNVLNDDEIEVLASMMNDDRTENIKRFVEAIKKIYGIGDTEGLSDTIHLYLKFMEAVREYRSDYRYNGNAVLIKAKTPSPIMGAFEDENLSVGKYCLGSFSVYTVGGDHRTFLTVDHAHETAEILNDILINKDDDLQMETNHPRKRHATN